MLKHQNSVELLSRSDGKFSILSKIELIGLSREFYFKEIYDTNDFEVSKMGRLIEWEQVKNFLKTLDFYFM